MLQQVEEMEEEEEEFEVIYRASPGPMGRSSFGGKRRSILPGVPGPHGLVEN